MGRTLDTVRRYIGIGPDKQDTVRGGQALVQTMAIVVVIASGFVPKILGIDGWRGIAVWVAAVVVDFAVTALVAVVWRTFQQPGPVE